MAQYIGPAERPSEARAEDVSSPNINRLNGEFPGLLVDDVDAQDVFDTLGNYIKVKGEGRESTYVEPGDLDYTIEAVRAEQLEPKPKNKGQSVKRKLWEAKRIYPTDMRSVIEEAIKRNFSLPEEVIASEKLILRDPGVQLALAQLENQHNRVILRV